MNIEDVAGDSLTIFMVLQYVQSGLMDNSTKADLLGPWMLLFTIFVSRKF
jgi:hypothetical protein